MSCNCTADYLGAGRLRIKLDDFNRLLEKYEEYQGLAESNFITERGGTLPSNVAGELLIAKMWWSGEGSGSGLTVLQNEILPLTLGHADILLTWEEGDSFSGLRVEDGKVTECDVVQTLQPKRAAQ